MNRFFLLFYSAIVGFKVNLVGQLSGNEILALFSSFSINSLKSLYRKIPDLKKVNIGYAIFFVFQMISDIINNSPANNMLRGGANIIMAIICTNYLTKILHKNVENVIYYLIGSAVSILIFGDISIDGIDLKKMSFFKFKMAPILNVLILIISIKLLKKYPDKKLGVVFLFILYGALCIALDARSNGLFFIFVSIIFYYKNRLRSISFKKTIPYLVVFMLLFQGLYSYYVFQTLSGNIGGEHSRVQLKRISNPYNPINLIVTGRAETYVGLLAALEKPIFGHGSWPKDPTGKYQLMVFNLHDDEQNYDSFFASNEEHSIIPSHSVLIGAWMSAGIFAFLAVIYVIFLFFKNGFNLLRNRLFINNSLYILVAYYIVNSSWIFLFSALGSLKLTLPIMISVVLVLNRKMELAEKQN
jgi:hypothetical protein